MVAKGDVRYARSGDAHVAYRVIPSAGGDDRDLVLLRSGTGAMDSLFDDPVAARWLEGLAECGRVIVFDRRGTGLSDPLDTSEWTTFGSWCDDLEAVIAA